MHPVLIANLVVSAASAAWAAVALIRPGSLSGSKTIQNVSDEVFFVRMYAARSIPFGLAAGLLPIWFAGVAVAWLVFTAAVIQILDIAIAISAKQRGMAVGAAVGATVHVACGLTII